MSKSNGDKVTSSDLITRVEGPKFRDGKIIVSPLNPDDLKTPVVIFKKVYPPDFLEEVRRSVVNHRFAFEDYHLNEAGLADNFKRYDDLRTRERRSCFAQIYSFYFWNQGTPEIVSEFLQSLTRFGNVIAGREENDRLHLTAQKWAALICASYPAGGMLGNHHFSDDLGGYHDRFDELVVQFAKYGRDYKEGGVHFARRLQMTATYSPSNHGPLEFVEPELDVGDIIAITIKDAYHRVTPVDPQLDYRDPLKGRFIGQLYYTLASDLKKLSASGEQSK